MTATKNKAKAMAKALTGHVNTLLIAKAMAQVERERVDVIQRRVLNEQNYCGDGERITDPKLTYLLDDNDANRYFATMNAIHLEAGFEDAAKGYCPALVAETLETQAEWALISAAEEFFPGVTNDKLLCGTATLGGLETREKYLDLLIGLVVNAPGYKPITV